MVLTASQPIDLSLTAAAIDHARWRISHLFPLRVQMEQVNVHDSRRSGGRPQYLTSTASVSPCAQKLVDGKG